MKRRFLSAALLLAVALGFAAFGVVKMRSTGADVSSQVPDPPESVFGEHTYTLPEDYEFAPPPEGLPPPTVSREEIIATVQGNLAGVQSDIPPRIASVDLVTVIRSPYKDQATSPFKGLVWLVVVQDALSSARTGGQPFSPDSPCNAPAGQRPASCEPARYRGTSFQLYDADTGKGIAGQFDGERCDIPVGGQPASPDGHCGYGQRWNNRTSFAIWTNFTGVLR